MHPADHKRWMKRCLQLALNGAGNVAPNPMVGSVLVHGDRIIAEGWHRKFGGSHAEVECLRSFTAKIPAGAILYVNLEPCAHHGKTPPCADLLIERGLKNVVIGMRDPFPQVAGKGIEKMKAAGIEVMVGVEEDQCRWLQRRFINSIEKNRPYIILKLARSIDGFLDRHPRSGRGVQRISNATTDLLVHRWRSEEQAIMIGSNTVINDDPQLTVRLVDGRQPLRVVLDRDGRSPINSKIFDGSVTTLLFTSIERNELQKTDQVKINSSDPLPEILMELDRRGIRSLLIEGGAKLLKAFLEKGLWDEARVITGQPHFGSGTPAPAGLPDPLRTRDLDGDRLDYFVNGQISPDPRWHW